MIEHIEYLIMSNDCVVIPGWGALIAQYMPSSYSIVSHRFIKPRREIGFNGSILHNDGLLANSIAHRHNMSYGDACKIIDNNVAVYKQIIDEGSEIPFGRLGFFSGTPSGGIEFIPFHHEIPNDEFFGLQFIDFKTLEQLARETENIASQDRDVATTPPHVATNISGTSSHRNRFARRFIQTAASIVLLLGLGFVLSTPIIQDKQHQEFASINVPSITAKHSPATPSKVQTAQPNRDRPVAQQPIVAVQPQTTQPTEQSDNNVLIEEKQEERLSFDDLKNNNSGKYYLVVSTLANDTQVKQYLQSHNELKDIAKVREKNGKHRIYIARGDNYGEMLKMAQQLPAGYGIGWVTTD